MNEDYFKEQAARVRQIASNADPFTKRKVGRPRKMRALPAPGREGG